VDTQVRPYLTRSTNITGKTIMIDTLMRKHYSFIFRLTLSILDDQDEAEDATQETFIRAAAHITEFRGDAEIKTWLSAIAVNVCRGELRKRRRRDLLENTMQVIQLLVGKSPDPEDQAAQNDLHTQLRMAVAGLDEKHRFPVILHYIQHMSVGQIAAIMETNENTIHSRLFHARRKLAMKLRDAQPEVISLYHDDQRTK
jgi:RNA polymerase sigma-70 factor, ECF subfamily